MWVPTPTMVARCGERSPRHPMIGIRNQEDSNEVGNTKHRRGWNVSIGRSICSLDSPRQAEFWFDCMPVQAVGWPFPRAQGKTQKCVSLLARLEGGSSRWHGGFVGGLCRRAQWPKHRFWNFRRHQLKFLDPFNTVKIARPWRKDDMHNSWISRGTIQRFACSLRKDDTYGADAAVSLVSVDTLGTHCGLASWSLGPRP